MPQLANNALRATNMKSLLLDMGIKLQDSQINCNGDFFILDLKNHSDVNQLSQDLQSLLQAPAVKLTLNDLIAAEIDAATCNDQATVETHKKSCLAIFNILQSAGLDYSFDQDKKHIELNLNPVYAGLFGCLTYKHISVTKDKIIFDLEKILQERPQSLFVIEDKLFMKAKAFEEKKVFYAQEQLSNDEIKVTPHFFTPNAACPPDYHFVLDTSGSMEGVTLDTLKKTVITFARTLFQFQPEATLEITQFNNTTSLVGTYNNNQLHKLGHDINKLTAKGHTCLYEATLLQLAKFKKTGHHNNVLLFTDGKNESYDTEQRVEEIQREMQYFKDKDNSRLTAINKVFVVSYDVEQPEILHEVTELFGSPIIYTQNPDFIDALTKQERMQEWAAKRELFTCTLEIINNTSSQPQPTEYVQALEMSGQFTALEPVICQKGEAVHLRILDGNSKVILDDTKTFAIPSTPTNNASALPNLSIFSNSGSKTDAQQPAVSQFVI